MKNPLIDAAVSGDKKTLKKLLATTKKTPEGILQTTIFSGWEQFEDMTILEMLLDAGADPNAPQKRDETPLQTAAHAAPFPTRSLAATELLIQYGADPNLYFNGESPLHHAVTTIGLHTTQSLLLHGADVNAISTRAGAFTQKGQTPTHSCVGHLYNWATDFGEISLEDLSDDDWNTANQKVLDHLHLLLEAGADLSLKDANGDDVLSSMFFVPHADPIRLALLHAGAPLVNVEIQNTPTDMLAASIVAEHSIEEVLLLSQQLDPRAPQKAFGDVPTFLVACVAHPNAALALAKADPTLAQCMHTKRKRTSLFFAAGGKNRALIDYLLAQGVDPKAKDFEGVTCLEREIEKGNDEVVGWLRELEG